MSAKKPTILETLTKILDVLTRLESFFFKPTIPVEVISGPTVNEYVRTILVAEEGRKDEVYPSMEKGNPTGGIGHKLTDAETVKMPIGTRLTDNQIETWYAQDVHGADLEARTWLIASWERLGNLRRSLAICMAFQMGDMSDWKPTAEHIYRGEWEEVKKHIQGSLWWDQMKDYGSERAERMAEMWVSGKLLDYYK